MILSSGRKYVFVHAPKTGGTALALALEARAMKDDIMLGDTPKAIKRRRRLNGVQAKGRLWKHSTLADIDGLVPTLDGYFAFTLVRNPWDRMVSYYHWLKTQNFEHPAVALANRLSFGDFVQSDTIRRSMRSNPARRYMTDAAGTERCNAYIRIEEFEQDSTLLWSHLGFTLKLDRVNVTQRDADYRAYFSDRTRQIIAEDYQEDILRFGYTYE